MATETILGTVWTDKSQYDDAERQHYENLAGLLKDTKGRDKEVSPVINPPTPNVPNVNQSKKSKLPEISVEKHQNESIEMPKIPAVEPHKNEGREKSSKKNKKAREAQRQRDLLNNSISNKDVPPSPTKDEEMVLSPLTKTDANPKHSKTKEAKEKQNKNDKKHSNKKDNANNASCKIEEKQTKNENIDLNKIDEKGGASQKNSSQCSLASEVAKARQHIKNSLECMDSVLASVPNVEVVNRLNSLEAANSKLQSSVDELKKIVSGLQSEMAKLLSAGPRPPMIAVCPMPSPAPPKAAPAKAAPPASSKDDSDDGVDLFASDSEEDDEAAAKIKEDRVAAYAAKKSSKPALIAKSNIILDVKPWDDETDMTVIEKNVRSLATDGLFWGVSKLVPVGYGIHKLRIACVVEDDKVSVDWLTEEIEKFEETVQSVDIHAFNKV